MKNIERLVRRHSLDRLLSAELLDQLRPLEVPAGDYILRVEEEARDLMFFVEGRAKVFSIMENGSSLLVRFYRPLELLGDVELYAFDRYLLNVQALTDVVCLCLPAELVRRSAEKNSALLTAICASLGRKLASFNATSAINLRYPLRNRLASYLLALSQEGGQGGSRSADYATDRLGELADLLGTSYRNLSRVVGEFRRNGILEQHRGQIRLHDPQRLAELARDIYL